MGFRLTTGRAAFGIALLLTAAASNAAPDREPLVVTTLADPEAELVAADGGGKQSSVEDRIAIFTRAIGEAAAAERQAIAARCRTIRDIPASGAKRELWEANCRYQRR